MKKISILILIILFLPGCSSGAPSVSGVPAGNAANSFYSAPLFIDKDYEVYDLSMNNRPVYQYFIFKNGDERWPNILDQGVIYACPAMSYTNGLLKMNLRIVSDSVDICKFYDIENGLESRWFTNPMIENGKLIVYPDEPPYSKKLIVQDIFDKSKYYLEIERNEAYMNIYAEFVDDGKRLRITYGVVQEDMIIKEKTETLDLYPAGD